MQLSFATLCRGDCVDRALRAHFRRANRAGRVLSFIGNASCNEGYGACLIGRGAREGRTGRRESGRTARKLQFILSRVSALSPSLLIRRAVRVERLRV